MAQKQSEVAGRGAALLAMLKSTMTATSGPPRTSVGVGPLLEVIVLEDGDMSTKPHSSTDQGPTAAEADFPMLKKTKKTQQGHRWGQLLRKD
jgi:hypothetical protein